MKNLHIFFQICTSWLDCKVNKCCVLLPPPNWKITFKMLTLVSKMKKWKQGGSSNKMHAMTSDALTNEGNRITSEIASARNQWYT